MIQAGSEMISWIEVGRWSLPVKRLKFLDHALGKDLPTYPG